MGGHEENLIKAIDSLQSLRGPALIDSSADAHRAYGSALRALLDCLEFYEEDLTFGTL